MDAGHLVGSLMMLASLLSLVWRPSPVAPMPRASVVSAEAKSRPATTGVQVQSEAGWQDFLKHSRAIKKSDVMPLRTQAGPADALPDANSTPLKRAVLLIPREPSQGLALALADLSQYLSQVTGHPIKRILYTPGLPPDLSQVPNGAQVIAIGVGAGIPGMLPAAGGRPDGYAIQANQINVLGRKLEVVGVTGEDLLGSQYGVYRLMTLSGKRFFHYEDAYTPPVGEAKLPKTGFLERYAPPDNMRVRGFAPHQYHPTPLSVAFHEPSPAHLKSIEQYIDWSVQTGQNSLKFELLDLDARNRFLPSTNDHKNLDAWMPYARQILAYAHARGVKVSINVAFANDVSNNVYAINPFKALEQTIVLDHLEGDPKQSASYLHHLDSAANEDAKHIHGLVDRLMQAPWDDISWCLGTREFSSTNEDLTVRWMNEAAGYLAKRYPATTTTVISHVPSAPKTKHYNDSYFNLADHADPAVGQLVHTTELYSLTDPAPVYGNKNFEHKLKQLYDANPARRSIYEPETSYWVSYDTSVPLFLPIYMASRAQDMAMIRDLPNLTGEMTFTTAWEWGYWLSDYAVARMQVDPTTNLTALLAGAFQPFGAARDGAVDLLRDTMSAQQRFLVDQGLMRDLQGASALTDLGATLAKVPGLRNVLQGTNSSPARLKPQDIMGFNAKRLNALQKGELAHLGEMVSSFRGLANRAQAIRPTVPTASARYFDELADGLEINALRAEEVYAALSASACAREAQLTGDSTKRTEGKRLLERAGTARDRALEVIRRREPHYRDLPADSFGTAQGPTMWNDRYLTPVHDGRYWRATYDEVAKLYK
jgi:hypothetical protein